jgi:anti-anti-sigma factor
MKTNVRRDGYAVIVSLHGNLDFETADAFRDSLLKLEKQAGGSRVIFDLGDLMFVGSSGIASFIQALREFNSRAAAKPRYTNVKNEFRRIISAFDEGGTFDFWDNTERALRSVDN